MKFQLKLKTVVHNIKKCPVCYCDTIWSASIKTVFKENFLPQKLNRSSRLGPNKSITRTLYSPSIPYHLTFGIPAAKTNKKKKFAMMNKKSRKTCSKQSKKKKNFILPPCKILYSFDSYNNCGCFVLTFS